MSLEKIITSIKQEAEKYGPFGRELKISPKSTVSVNKPGAQRTYYVESVSVLIGIGKDHTAELTMCKDAWEAFKQGEPIDITTFKEFKNKWL